MAFIKHLINGSSFSIVFIKPAWVCHSHNTYAVLPYIMTL